MKAGVKAGKLANGLQKDQGKIVHAIEDTDIYIGPALCGTRPANQWSERDVAEVSCETCQILLSLRGKP